MATFFVVLAAFLAWLFLAATYFRFHFAKPFAPAPTLDHATPPLVVQQTDLRHIADIIAASQNNTPILVVGAVFIVAIFAWAFVRVDGNRRRYPDEEMRRFYRHNPAAIERPKEEYRGNLPVVVN